MSAFSVMAACFPVSATTCLTDLTTNAVPVRLFPWPRPAPGMIAALRSFAASPPWVGHPALTAALAEAASPDRVIARMFDPVSLNDVRSYYGPNSQTPPEGHELGVDKQGLRSLLARTLEAIDNPDLQLEWMEYMGYDASLTVRVSVVRTALSWTDPLARDAFVISGLASPPDRAVMAAALTRPEVLSPAVRWRLITVALNPQRLDTAVLQAINTFKEKPLLRAWYQDLIAATRLGEALRTYDPAWRGLMTESPKGPRSLHEKTAIVQGDALAHLAGEEVRARWIAEFTRVAAEPTALGGFAGEILKQARTRMADEDAAVRARLSWTERQMQEFERSL